MPTDRLARFRSWPSGIYTDQLTRLWRAEHPLRSREVTPSLAAPPARPRRVAVIAHVFYLDLLDELGEQLKHLERTTATIDLFASVVRTEDRQAVVAWAAERNLGRADVRVVPNRGRDIAPKYVAFADVYDLGHDLILFLHTKKSTYEHIGTPWRNYLYRSLVGSAERANGIFMLFDEEPRLGVVAPRHYGPMAPYIVWHGSFLYARRLARRMGVVVTRWAPPDFASGSMFWARPEALAPITGLGLRLGEFPPEARQIIATNMHALERLVFVAAEHAGYTVALLTPVDESVALPAAPPASPSSVSRPTIGMRLLALPPTAAQMARDVDLRRRRYPPRRIISLLTGTLRGR